MLTNTDTINMVNKKIKHKKNITSAMKELEEAILDNNTNSSINKSKSSLKKNKLGKNTDVKDILLLTDIVEKSSFLNRNVNKIALRKSIQSIVESDIKLWIKTNMHRITDNYVKQALNTINSDKN
jgi:hypothetical protein|tara:strand:- start:375 stop:749 length:375 start_codon:yes stop_codon:yes gene_type:complete